MNTTTLPVLQMAELDTPAGRRALDRACRVWGGFQLLGHGLPTPLLGALHREMRAFFALPQADKRRISRTETNPWGFFDEELTQNRLDWKEIFDYGPDDGQRQRPQWPQRARFRRVIQAYCLGCEKVSMRLLRAIEDNLCVGANGLCQHFAGGHTSFLRLNYYPPCDAAPDEHFGVSPHTDSGALTLLLQDDQSGLEVWHDQDWWRVEPLRGALVVNLGDIVQVWSNDRYAAPLHRVVTNRHAARYSAPYFVNPAYVTDYQPLASMVDGRHPPRYRPINWGEFRRLRALGDYRDCGTEVQISHYRIEENSHELHSNYCGV